MMSVVDQVRCNSVSSSWRAIQRRQGKACSTFLKVLPSVSDENVAIRVEVGDRVPQRVTHLVADLCELSTGVRL